MPAMRRSPGQTMFTLVLLLVGIWVGIGILRGQFQQEATREEPQTRPDFHLQHVEPAELVAVGYDAQALQLPWTDISMRFHVGANGDFVRLIGCHIPARATTRLISSEPTARRPLADRPPPWWPWDRSPSGAGPSSPFQVPAWFTGIGDQCAWFERRSPDANAWEGLWVAYDSEAQYLWLWQWRRSDWQPPVPPTTTIEPIDALAQGLGAHLIALRHPVAEGGWINRPAMEAHRAGIPAEVLPAGLTRFDACLRPNLAGGGHDYLVALHGVRPADLPLLLRDHPLRPLPNDAPPPDWQLARPDDGLPSWFDPGPGPRWATAKLVPGPGTVLSARWVAYEPQRQRLLVWDWARPSGGAGAADPAAGHALPEWPADPWALVGLAIGDSAQAE